MDVFPLQSTNTGLALEARVGGSPFNVAVGLARLGQRVAFFGAMSTGFMGERLLRALQDEGVGTSTVERTEAPTTLGLIGLDAHGLASYVFYGDSGADRRLGAEALRLVTEVPAAIHVGSFSTVVEPVASTLRELITRERGRALISYDPNVRLNVEPDRARWRDTVDWMLRRADLIKVSDEDLELLFPGVPAEAFCERALANGVRLVVVTRGSFGVVAAMASTRVAVPAVSAPVIDTVGAGDSF